MIPPIRLLLVDDEPRVRKGLSLRLGAEPDLQVIGEASNGADALLLADDLRPDVVLLDVNMPGMDGLQAADKLSRREGGCRIVMVSLQDDAATRRRASEAGAMAFVGKQEGSEKLVSVIRAVADAAVAAKEIA